MEMEPEEATSKLALRVARGKLMFAQAPRFVPLALLTALCLAATNAAATSAAADDSQQFVDALRQRGYFDTAADYLQHLSAATTLPDEAKRTLDFQQAQVLIEGASAIHDPQLRGWQLDEAQTRLREFLAANPDDTQAQTARERLAGMLRYRADQLMHETNKTGSVSTANRKQAQAWYTEARALYDEAAKRYRADLDKIPKGEQPDKREQLGTSWLGSLISAAQTTFDLAQTFDAGSPDAQKLLNDAVAQCKKLYADYPRRGAGLAARFYEGRCYQELGDSKSALAAYDDLIAALPDNDPDFRKLKTQAFRYALQCWIQDKNYTGAIDKALAWAKSAHGPELQDPDWLAVKLSTATALEEAAHALPKNDFKAKSYLRDARDLVVDTQRSGNPAVQDQAREMLAQLGGAAPSRSAPPRFR